MKRWALVAFLCGCPRAAIPDAGFPDDAGPRPPPVEGLPVFALGVEYMETGLGLAYTELGLSWAKARPEGHHWGVIERTAPMGDQHTYDFACLDGLVTEWQGAGFANLHATLNARSDWGSVSAFDFMPRPDRIDDYRDWVRAVVERYDGDGVSDMPNLRQGVHHWVVGPEWTGFWPSGDADDYIALAEVTIEEARAADPDALFGTIPFMMLDVFEGDVPSDAEIDARLEDPPPAFRKSTAGMMKILDRLDLFDTISIHSLGDYTEIPPTIDWLNEQMTARGTVLPIWIDDAFPMGFLANSTWPAVFPVDDATKPAFQALLDDAANFDADAIAWLSAESAKGAVKKAVVALAEGAIGINVGNTEDWTHDDLTPIRNTFADLIGAAGHMGMIDVAHDDGYDLCDPRTPGAPRAPYLALKLLGQRIGDGAFDSVERIASDDDVWAFLFVRADAVFVVAWSEDRALQLPGESEAPVPFTLDVTGASRVEATPFATTADAPATTNVPIVDGAVTLQLTSTPVLLDQLP